MLDQQPVRRDLLYASDESDEQNASAPAERGQGRVEEVATDRVEADVRALAVRERQHAIGEIFARIVDGLVRPALARDRQLFGGARARDDARAHRLADFHRREADTARRAEDEQRLARLEPPLPADRDV